MTTSGIVQNPDNGLWYRFVARNGNADPETGQPVIVGQWVLIPRSEQPGPMSECSTGCCSSAVWRYVRNPDNGLYYLFTPREGNINPDTEEPIIVGEWVEIPRVCPGEQDDEPDFVVLNADNGRYYRFIPRDGNVDPITGDPVIVGEWQRASASDAFVEVECTELACCPASPWTYSSY